MGYAKNLSDEGFEVMRGLGEKILKLKGGEVLTLEDSEEALNRLRSIIYTWLHANGIKKFIVLKRETPLRLRIVKKVELSPKVVDVGGEYSIIETFVMDNMLEVEDASEAQSIINDAIASDELRLEDSSRVIEEWQRICGS